MLPSGTRWTGKRCVALGSVGTVRGRTVARHALSRKRDVARGAVYECSECEHTVIAAWSGAVIVAANGDGDVRHAKVNPIRRTKATGVIQPFNLGP